MVRRRGKVLVLGEDTRSFLSVIRSFGRRGLEVDVGWCPPESPAASSRYIARVHDIPRATSAAEGPWKPELLSLIKWGRFDLVVPTTDSTLIPLQLHKEAFENDGRTYLLSDRAFEVALDKVRVHELALRLGVPVARGVVVSDGSEIASSAADLSYPVVVKPSRSYSLADLSVRNEVERAPDFETCVEHAEMLGRYGDVLVQEHFDGTTFGLGLIAHEGRILTAFQYERLHQPPEGGQSSYRRSVPVDREFLEDASRFMEALAYTGVAMLEFRKSRETGARVLIEINPRFWGSLPLAISAGQDFPYALWELLVEGRRIFPQSYRTDVYARNLKSDLKWIWTNIRADRDDPALEVRSPREVLGELANPILLRERNDTLARDDLKPALVEIAQVCGHAIDVLRPAFATNLQRVGLECSARQSLAKSNRVLLVCLGNICRSPFAATILRSTLGREHEVRSAGTLRWSGRRSPLLTVEAGGEFGVDLSGHRSVALSADLVDWADVIFVFDYAHRRQLLKEFPRARRKLHFFGALARSAPLVITDPLGSGAQEHLRVYRQIADIVAELAGIWVCDTDLPSCPATRLRRVSRTS